jgi:hypothetical protein
MNGQQLLNLLLEHQIGVRKASLDLFELSLVERAAGDSPANGSQV